MIDNTPHEKAGSGRPRLWVPLAVVAFTLVWVIVAVAAGRALPGQEPLSSGAAVEVGGAEVTDLDGWTLHTADSDLAQQIVLERGDQVLLLSYHHFGRKASDDAAWDGFERVLGVSAGRDGGARFGDRESFPVAGAHAEWSDLQVADRSGGAFVVTADDGREAVEGTVLGPSHTASADRDAALAVVQSVQFFSNMEAS
jgi:hypothetical protein